MIPSIVSSLLLLVVTSSTVNAQNTTTAPDPLLVGTWSSKSRAVITGPDFYDPALELMKEPRLPGSSFSFTADGYYEEALYIVVSNPTRPGCPTALLQWQHGQYTVHANGSLTLAPIKVDGRQLLSDPCNYDKSIYTRYNQTELYKWYEIFTDQTHDKKRLNLYKHDGAPMNPMYLEFSPPQMLPTTTLRPLSTATGTGAKKGKLRRKREFVPETLEKAKDVDADQVWWIGIALTGLGLVGCLWV